MNLVIPYILTTTNEYFTDPTGFSVKLRNDKESFYQKQVKTFFEKLGFETLIKYGDLKAYKDTTVVSFVYSIRGKTVVKTLNIKKDGKRSNISLIRKMVEEFNVTNK